MLTPLQRAQIIMDERRACDRPWHLLTHAVRDAIGAVLDHCGHRTECVECATECWMVRLANGKELVFDSSGSRHDDTTDCDVGMLALNTRAHTVIREEHENPEARYADHIRWEMERFLNRLGTPATCKGCGCVIFWALHKNGKRVPYSREGVNHWQDCPAAPELRKQYPRKKETTGCEAAP